MASLQIMAAASQSYPFETMGELLGEDRADLAMITAVQVHRLDEATRCKTFLSTERDERVKDFLEDYIIGGFHSHPDEYPTASQLDKDDFLENYPDGVMVICGIWPSKRAPWAFRWKAYAAKSGRVRRIKLSWE